MQSEADRTFQQNVLNFKGTLQSKATWEELEAYVGCKLERGNKFKAFILAYLNRDFEPLSSGDGRQYYYAKKAHRWLDEGGHLKACWRARKKDPKATYYEGNKDVIKKQKATYYENNKDVIKKQKAAYYENNKDAVKKQKATYYENKKDAIKKYRATYYRDNKELLIKKQMAHFKKDVAEKRFYCKICDVACISNYDLKKHCGTLNHSYAWLNSLD